MRCLVATKEQMSGAVCRPRIDRRRNDPEWRWSTCRQAHSFIFCDLSSTASPLHVIQWVTRTQIKCDSSRLRNRCAYFGDRTTSGGVQWLGSMSRDRIGNSWRGSRLRVVFCYSTNREWAPSMASSTHSRIDFYSKARRKRLILARWPIDCCFVSRPFDETFDHRLEKSVIYQVVSSRASVLSCLWLPPESLWKRSAELVRELSRST